MSVTSKELMKDPDFIRLKSFIISKTGLSYFEDKNEQLADRLLKRFTMLNEQTCEAYLKRLEFGSMPGSEMDLLVTELTIGETYFFRHTEQFNALRSLVIPDLLLKNRESKRLSIWCAGCSTGAEPYSVSIMLRREFRNELQGWTIEILGSDINRSFLDRASAGRFDEWHLRSTGEDLRNACFSKVGKSWQINPEFQDGVSFIFHNLISGSYPPKPVSTMTYDVILCRNVMIYFSQQTIMGILPQFKRCLSPNGWMLLGYSEINTELYRDFELVPFPGAILFRKTSGPSIYASAPAQWTLSSVPKDSGLGFLPCQEKPISSLPLLPTSPAHSTSDHMSPEAKTESPLKKSVSPEVTSDPYAVGRSAYEAGNFSSALAIAETLIGQDSLDARAHLIKAQALLQLKREVEAEDILLKAIYINRNFIMAHYLLGMLYAKNRQADKATRFLTNAANLLDGLRSGDKIPEGNGMTVAELLIDLKSMGGAA